MDAEGALVPQAKLTVYTVRRTDWTRTVTLELQCDVQWNPVQHTGFARIPVAAVREADGGLVVRFRSLQ